MQDRIGHHTPLRLYAMQTDALAEQKVFEKALQCIPAWRRRIVQERRSDADRRLSAAASLLLVRALTEAGYNWESIVRMQLLKGEYGKPYLLPDEGRMDERQGAIAISKTSKISETSKRSNSDCNRESEIYFNLSHSGVWAICSIGTVENGCDVERIREKTLGIAKRFFPEEEKEWISQADSDAARRERFTRLWTLRESYVKATGKGMAEELKSFLIRPEERRVFLLGQTEQEGHRAELQASGYYLKEYEIAEGYCCAACSLQDAFEDQIRYVKFA